MSFTQFASKHHIPWPNPKLDHALHISSIFGRRRNLILHPIAVITTDQTHPHLHHTPTRHNPLHLKSNNPRSRNRANAALDPHATHAGESLDSPGAVRSSEWFYGTRIVVSPQHLRQSILILPFYQPQHVHNT